MAVAELSVPKVSDGPPRGIMVGSSKESSTWTVALLEVAPDPVNKTVVDLAVGSRTSVPVCEAEVEVVIVTDCAMLTS